MYDDYIIFASPSSSAIDKSIQDLRDADFDIEYQVNICDYLGINVTKLPDRRIKLYQTLLIDQIIKDVKLHCRSARVSIPAKSTRILRRYLTAPFFDRRFNYQSVIGKLNFLNNSTCVDISYATHQVDLFFEDTLSPCVEAVDHLVKYICNSRDEGLILGPKSNKSFELFSKANFVGNWYRPTAYDDPIYAKYCSGYVITYEGCPITWISCLQTTVALSICKSEYVSLSQSLRDTIPLMGIMVEFKTRGFDIMCEKPIVR